MKKLKLISIFIFLIVLSSSLFGILIGNHLYVDAASAEDMRNYQRTFSTVYNCSKGHICTPTQGYRSVGIDENLTYRQTSISKCNYPNCTGTITALNNHNMEKIINIREDDMAKYYNNVYCVSHGQAIDINNIMGNFYAVASAEIRGKEATLKTYTKYGWEKTAMTRTVTCLQNNEMAAVLNCIGNDTKGYERLDGQNSDTQLAIWRGWSTWVEATDATRNLFETCAGNDKWEDNGNRNSETAWNIPASYAQNGTGRYFSADMYFLVYDSELNPYNGSGMQIDSFQNLILVIPHGEITSVSVTKNWVNNGLTQPSSVKVNLLANGTKVDSVTLNSSNSWKYTFKNLDASKTYTVTEDTVTGYSTSITGSASSGFTITNTGQVVSINVTKKWVDNSNNLSRRPGSVTVRLYKNGTKTDKTISITGSSTGNTWTGSFTGLPKYDNSGNVITYTIKEENANQDYKCEITGTASSGFTITNTLTEMIDLRVIKSWNDGNNNDGVRPSSVTIRLYKDGVDTTRTLTLSNSNSWQGSFLKVPKYKYNGTTAVQLNYTIKEDYVPGYAATYSKSGNQFTVTNTHEVSNISLTVKKVWNDDNNRDGKRPQSLTVWVTCNETGGTPVSAILNEENNWSYTWTRWSQYYEGTLQQFKVYEVPPEGYECTNKYSVGFGSSEGWITIGNGYSTDSKGNVVCTITNRHIPETIDLKVQKVWNSDNNTGLRPSVIYADLYANGVRYKNSSNMPVSIQLSDSNNWTNTYTNLPKYINGTKVTYTLKESSSSDSRLFKYYTTYISKSSETNDLITYKITNTFKQEYMKIKVRKVWDDNLIKEFRPDKVRFTISRKLVDGTISGLGEWIELTEDNYIGIDSQGRDIWEAELGFNLAKYYGGGECDYILKETAYRANSNGTYTQIDSDFAKYYETPVIENDGGVNAGGYILKTYTATNKIKTKTIPVEKVWSNGQGYGITPDNITIYLCKNGERTSQTIRLTADGNWKGEFTDLQIYDENGNEITYTVEENQQEYFNEPVITGNSTDGFVVTNSIKTIRLKVTKIWEDNNNELGNRSANISFDIYRNGQKVDRYILNEGNSWTENISLPQYYLGEECEYTVKEVPIDYYDTSITGNMEEGYIITNRAQPLRNITVTKKWDDMNNKYSLRPTSYSDSYIDIELYQNNQATARTTRIWGTPDSEEWGSATFKNLPIYDSNGNEIQYTVKEIDIPEGYNSILSGSMAEGFSIINKVKLTKIKKIWQDNNNANGNRPESISVDVYKGNSSYNIYVDDITLSEENGWEYELFLPEGTYNVKERSFDNYSDYEILREGNREEGYTITNALLLTIPVTKVWNDEENRDGIRPGSVTVELYKNDIATGQKIALSDSNNWTATFSGLKNFENGERIKYEVIEKLPDGYTAQISGSMLEGYTITNTHIPEKIEVPVTKEWNDDNNRDGIRPENIQVDLLANGIKVDTVTLNSGKNWVHTFTNLPKNENGQPLEYKVVEVVPNNYTVSYSNNGNEWTITNTHEIEKTSVEIKPKVWNDDGNRDGIRPNSVDVKLLANGVNIDTVTLNSSNNWSHKFTNLPKNENGNLIQYIVEEVVPEKYTASYSNNGNIWTITNTHEIEKTSVEIKPKVWNDDGNRDGIRPNSVDVKLLANGVNIDTVTLNSGNNWSYKFTNLPKNENGNPIQYIVEEVVPEEYTASYSNNGNEWTITNTYIPKTLDVTIIKTWTDEDDADGIRPDSIEIQLYKTVNGTKTSMGDGYKKKLQATGQNGKWESSDLTHTWEGLYEYENGYQITYSVEEIDVNGYDKLYQTETDAQGNIVININNKYISEKIDLSIEKVWNDNNNEKGKRPNSIDVLIKRDGNDFKTVTLSQANSWKITENLNRYYDNGKVATYTVSESYAISNYESSISGDMLQGFTITNTFVNTIHVSVTKKWEDDNNADGLRPESIRVGLLKNGVSTGDIITLSNENRWFGQFTNLKDFEDGEYLTYTVEELDNLGKYTSEVIENEENIFTITNKYKAERTEIIVTKQWDDDDNRDGIRPGSAEVKLLANNIEVDSIILNSTNSWEHTFTNLLKNENGQPIEYKVVETVPNNYTANYSNNGNEWTITNIHEPEKIDIQSVTKIWDDNNNRDGIRPESITIVLLANGESVKTISIENSANSFNIPILGVYKYEDGQPIKYTVQEAIVPTGYEANVTGNMTNGFTITNKHSAITTEVSVSKTWDDDNNRDGIRPESIEVELLANGVKVNTATLNSSNWTHTFTNLLKNENGNSIKYTVQEANVSAGYESNVTGSMLKGFVIENKHIPITTEVTVSKTWKDDNNRDGIRPESVEVALVSNGTRIDTTILSSTNNWAHTFTNLLKNENGESIEYTVEEVNVPTGYEASVTGSMLNGFIITNTHNPIKTEISVSKTWDDDNNRDGIRPTSVEIDLLANGVKVNTVTLNSSKWTHTFTNLLKNENAQPIEYTVQEAIVPTGYKANVTGNMTNGFTITNKHSVLTTEVSVFKTWDDDNNRDGIRPESIEVELLANGVKVNTATLNSSNWTHTFTNLPKNENGRTIEYTVQEVNIPTGYESNLTGNMANGFIITNKHEIEKKSIKVTKQWKDDNNRDQVRTESVKVYLLGVNNEEVGNVILSDSNSWTHTFTDIPKNSEGREIQYTVEEDVPNEYTVNISEKNKDEFTIVNTHAIKRVDVILEKRWEDYENKYGLRPEAVKFKMMESTLTDANGNHIKDYDTSIIVKEITLTESENAIDDSTWRGVFEQVPYYGKHWLYEEPVIGYTSNVGQEETWDNEIDRGWVITNKLQITSASVEIVWDDYDNEDGSRPSSIKLNLNRNGQKQQEVTLDESNNWKIEFEGLPIYNTDGTEFIYTIEQQNIDGYTVSYSNVGNNWTITNIHIPQIGIEVKKVWDDQNNLDEYRKDHVYAALYKNNVFSGSIKLDESNEWTAGWESLDKYDENRRVIKYDIKEKLTSRSDSAERIPEYEEPIYDIQTRIEGRKAITSYTITNKRTPKYDGYIEIKGKVWLDGSGAKANEINGVFDENSTVDKGLEGIKVSLKDEHGNLFDITSTAITDANGNYTIRVNYDNSKNVYKLYEKATAVREKLKDAYVEFEYDGNLYTTVKDVSTVNYNNDEAKKLTELSSNNKSKATENNTLRNNFDTAHSGTTASTSKSDEWTDKMITASTIAMSNYDNEQCSVITKRDETIKYCNGLDRTYIRTNPNGAWKEILNGELDLATNPDHNESEHTSDGHIMKAYEVEVQIINNINLGLFEREQPQVAIFEDISNVEIKMNEQKYNYLYNVVSDLPQNSVLQVKFQNKDTYTYRRPVNPADIAYINKYGNNGLLTAEITYTVKIGNLSTTLPITVNEIINAYDSQYTLTNVSVPHDKYNETQEAGFKTINIGDLQFNIQPGHESEPIKLTYEISDSALKGLLEGDATLNNAVEIMNYTTYYGENTLYAEQQTGGRTNNRYGGRYDAEQPGNAGFKINSVGRIDIENDEFDTDIAPSFVLTIKDDPDGNYYYKTVSGTVWEDTDKDKNAENRDNERLGNGKRDNNETNGVKDVKVELLKVKDYGTELVTLYRINETGEEVKIEEKPASTYTDSSGNYSFTKSEDEIPWSIVTEDTDYIIRFTYGDYETISTKINDVSIDSRDYKSTIITEPKLYEMFAENKEDLSWYYNISDGYSIAVDDISKLPTDNLRYGNFDSVINMTADSKPFRLGLVYDSSDNEGEVNKDAIQQLNENEYIVGGTSKEFKNDLSVFDFGIIGKPKEDIFVESSVEYLKLSLANGQVITNGNPSDNSTLNYVKAIGFKQDIRTGEAARMALDKQAIIELDAELIQGAQLEVRYNITVKNNSEESYDEEKYYYYGEKSEDSETVRDSVEKFVWYMDKDLVWESFDEDYWTSVTVDELKEEYISVNTEKAIKEGYLPYVTTELFKNIAPGESESTSISAKRMLTNSDENTFDTQAEILEINSKIARTLDITDNGPKTKTYKMGNYVPSTAIRVINEDIDIASAGLHEQDDDRIRVVITPPTGLVTYIIRYSVITLGALIVIGGVVLFIKKRVLRN